MRLCWARHGHPVAALRSRPYLQAEREACGWGLDLNLQVSQYLSSFPKFTWAPWGLGISHRRLWAWVLTERLAKTLGVDGF